MKEYLMILQNNKLFRGFSEEKLLALFYNSHAKVVTYKKNNLIYIENQKCTTLDIILEGRVLVQKIHESGNTLTISEFHQGENIGGNLVFADNHYYPMTVIAKSNCVLLHLEKDFVLELCQSNRVFLYELLRSLSSKTVIISGKLNSIALGTIRQRILEFLAHEYYKSGDLKVTLNMSKKEWSEKLGVQRPSLSRELMKMKKEGLIDYSKRDIWIKDIDTLKKLSAFFSNF